MDVMVQVGTPPITQQNVTNFLLPLLLLLIAYFTNLPEIYHGISHFNVGCLSLVRTYFRVRD